MNVTMMEPMLPEEAASHSLEDSALRLAESACGLAKRVHPILRQSVGDLIRSMNCYYSNLIEGHNTHPRDIERALAEDFSDEPRKRDLQIEAVAHIHVQKLIDDGRDPAVWPASAAYASWLHQQFCEHLPSDMLWVENQVTGERHEIVPGQLRHADVAVGRHEPPHHEFVASFLARFDQAYTSPPLNRMRQIQSVGAVHHRFLWIHPFLDGNGRVARLMSHALLRRLGIGTGLWSVARGLAREEAAYKFHLAAADLPRRGDRDGRGNLTQSGLLEFCRFFLERSIRYLSWKNCLTLMSCFNALKSMLRRKCGQRGSKKAASWF